MSTVSLARLVVLSLLASSPSFGCATQRAPTSTPPIAAAPTTTPEAPAPQPETTEPETTEPEATEPATPDPEPPAPEGPVALTDEQVQILLGTPEDSAPEHRGGVTKEREDKHYLAGNERSLEIFRPIIEGVGGGYVGVGTDQAYLFMSWARPEIAWLIDYDPAVVEVHEIYRLFFQAAATPEEFVALWDKPAREQALALFTNAHDERRAKSLRRWYLGYRGWIHRRLVAVARGMEKAEVPTYLTHQEHYDFIRQMLEQRRVRPMVVNLHDKKGMRGVAQAAQQLGVPIRVLYLSNAEEYWPRYPKQYRQNIADLPFHEDAVVLRTLLIWQVNTDYRYNVQPVANYLQWLAQPYIDDVYDITHGRPKAQAEGINFFETTTDPEQSPSAKRWHKAQAEKDAGAAG
ncbi:LIC_10091 family protein [Paraliomyxa miuraensis]|uniref:LIC_10091 family protein n=1 Tax=Paraliomyxa miuraensis TaxID=376150 RepID=UPI0022577DA5|nr:hypothetical protein [Paraliomyxa miuraensis]MCX4240878.1 hypothetical protein [Paraliomyxa miuraensis]